jgi:hypothetical protein
MIQLQSKNVSRPGTLGAKANEFFDSVGLLAKIVNAERLIRRIGTLMVMLIHPQKQKAVESSWNQRLCRIWLRGQDLNL